MLTDHEELAPDPGPTIEALSSLGYSSAAAVADIVDNSFSKSAGVIRIQREFDGLDSWCAIIDDGEGMDEQALKTAMRIGSRSLSEARDARDHGRFGFGLKTASFSQCNELTVSSRIKSASEPSVKAWDLDYVKESNSWGLSTSASFEAARILSSLDNQDHGTIVLWRRLREIKSWGSPTSRMAEKHFIAQTASMADYLGTVYGKLLESGPEIFLNSHSIAGWDPFLQGNMATQILPEETLELAGSQVVVRPYVLPHASKLTVDERNQASGPKGWNGQQGFYVYRQGRLISSGTWLGLRLPSTDIYNLARIEVDVPPVLDRVWNLSVTKSSVEIPPELKTDMLRIAKATRTRAEAVSQARSAHRPQGSRQSVVPLWTFRSLHGELQATINREHPAVSEVLEQRPTHEGVSRLLHLLESAISLTNLSGFSGSPSTTGAKEKDQRSTIPLTVLEIAEELLRRHLSAGRSMSEAVSLVMGLEPFSQYETLHSKLTEGNFDK